LVGELKRWLSRGSYLVTSIHTGQLITISNSMKSSILFWPLWASVHMWHSHTHTPHTHTHTRAHTHTHTHTHTRTHTHTHTRMYT
jgi:ABC-type Zn2+ transport system substrate-binding protein/surface adhesin